MTTDTLSRGQKVAADIAAQLKARAPLIWIVTREESRVEAFIAEAAASVKYSTQTWDVAQGVCTLDGKKDKRFTDVDANATLTTIRSLVDKDTGAIERTVWIMRDLPVWISGAIGAAPLRNLRNLVRWLPGVKRDSAQAIIVLSPNGDIPPELANDATVIDWPLPDRSEIEKLLDAALKSIREDSIREAALPAGSREAAIDAAVGLSGAEAQGTYSRSLVTTRKIDPVVILAEKKKIIAREKVLEWIDPVKDGLDAVGGLENLKGWLVARKNAYSKAARDYGLPMPKGTFVFGVSGCGKSLIAKCTSAAWEVPLLRLDLNALKGKFVGESEGNLRKALRVIDAIGRCIVWIDEVEKAMQGATSGSADGGVSADALGTILTWMQERQGGAFLIATANEVDNLPPELMRKGRFDEMWFVDLPTEVERCSVLSAALRANGRGNVKIDLQAVAQVCNEFTGAEIAALVPDALYAAFAEDAREINTADLLKAAKGIVPLAKTAAEKVGKLREWSVGRARPATKKDEFDTGERITELDLDIEEAA